MAVRILFLSSGGADSDIALQLLMQDNPTVEFHSLTIEVNDQRTLDDAKALADKMGITHEVLPFEATRQYIHGKNPNTTTAYWAFQSHLMGAQYAVAHEFDFVASGGDASPLLGDVEALIYQVMDIERYGKKITFLRPMREVKDITGREAMRAKIKNPK